MKKCLSFVLLSLALFLHAPAFAKLGPDALPAGATLVTSVEGITEYQLKNGLRVLLAPDESKPTVTVNTTYLVGSRHENYGETGMAHLLEHLIFKGTPTYPLAFAEMQKRGMRMNGTTWVDRTNYFASFAANEADLDWYLRWSADAMTNSFIAKKDLDSEMTVVRNEMEMGENDPFRSLYGKALAAAYRWHNYGKDTIGARADVENVSIERLQAFYRKYYQPDNAVLVVTGKFNEAKTLKLISETFGALARPERKLETHYTLDAAQDGETTVTVRRVGDTQIVLAMYHTPPAAGADFAALKVLAQILGDTPSGRLHKALVENKLAAAVFAFPFQTREPGILTFAAQLPNSASLDAARTAMVKVLDGLAQEPISEAEVKRAQQKMLKDIELTLLDPEKVGVALTTAIAIGDWRLLFLGRDQIRAVKREDVQRVGDSYLVPDNRTVALFIPTDKPKRAPAPAKLDVAPLVADYKGDAPVAQGEAFDPSPANIDARTEHTKLANGMKLALLAKKTRGEIVNLQLRLHFGNEQNLQGRDLAGAAAAELLRRGVPGMTRAQISETFDQLKARPRYSGDAAGVTASLEVPRQNLAAALRLLVKTLREPTFPENEFAQLQQEQITAAESQRKEPQDLAVNRVRRTGNPYAKGDPRYVRDFDEEIADWKALRVDEIKAFHAGFYGANFGEASLVGDFDAAAVKPLLEELLGKWTSRAAYQRLPRPAYAVVPQQQRLETPDKANAMYYGVLRLPMQDTDADFPALYLANYILGTGPASRLWARIREKEGLSYGVGSSLNASPFEPSAQWVQYAIFAPENRERLQKAFSEEFERAGREGFTEEEVAKGKNGVLQARKLARAQDATLMSKLAANEELGRRMAFEQAFEDKLQALSLAQVNAALRKHLDWNKTLSAVAGDFAKAKSAK